MIKELLFAPESLEVKRQLSMMLHGEEDHLISAYDIEQEVIVYHEFAQVVSFAITMVSKKFLHNRLIGEQPAVKADKPGE